MSKQFVKNEKMLSNFIECVNNLGGENCTNWNLVADFMHRSYQLPLKPQEFKYIWNLIMKKRLQFDADQTRFIVKNHLEAIIQNTNPVVQVGQLVNLKLKTYQYRQFIIKQFQANCLRNLIEILARRKQYYKKLFRRFEFKSICLLLQVVNLKFDDPLTTELKEASVLFKNIINCYADHMDKTKTERYHELSKVITRSQFQKVLSSLEFIHLLKMIYRQKLSTPEDMFQHPYLKPNLEDNYELVIYKELVEYKDWRKKIALFNESLDDPAQADIHLLLMKNLEPKIRIGELNKTQKKFGIEKTIYNRDFKQKNPEIKITDIKYQPAKQIIKEEPQKILDTYEKYDFMFKDFFKKNNQNQISNFQKIEQETENI